MKRILIAACLLTTPCYAQQQQQTTPTEQAMSARILQEVQAALTCNVNLINAQAELAKAQARIKELEDAKKEAK